MKLNPTIGLAGDSPLGVMNQPVMEPAEMNAVVEVGWAAFGPVRDVVEVAAAKWSLAVRPTTTPVA
jgi:hypothetical protein